MNSSKRLKILTELVDTRYKNWTQFSRDIGKLPSYMSEVRTGKRDFTEKLAREVEIKLGLEPGRLDKDDALLNSVKAIPCFSMQLEKSGSIFDENIIDYSYLALNSLGKIRNNGDSLCAFRNIARNMEPTILENAIVIVDTSDTIIVNNKIYAISIKNEIFINRIEKALSENKLILKSDNDKFTTQYLSLDLNELINFNVIGRVIHVIQAL